MYTRKVYLNLIPRLSGDDKALTMHACLFVYIMSVYQSDNLVPINWVLLSLQVEAENFPEISLKYEVVAVPTFLLLKV